MHHNYRKRGRKFDNEIAIGHSVHAVETHIFKLVAEDRLGKSIESKEAEGYILPEPTLTSVSKGDYNDRIVIVWEDLGDMVESYEVLRFTSASMTGDYVSFTTKENTYEDRDAGIGTDYFYTVRSKKDEAVSTYEDEFKTVKNILPDLEQENVGYTFNRNRISDINAIELEDPNRSGYVAPYLQVSFIANKTVSTYTIESSEVKFTNPKTYDVSNLQAKGSIYTNDKSENEAGYIAYDEKTGINPQDDAFLQKPVWDFAGTPAENHPLLLHYHPLCLNRFQVCKQADTVLAHFVHEDYQSEETMRRSYDWYEKITTHDSSLSACIFGIMAARLGDMEKSVRYFSESSMLDITNAHHNTGDGIHTANMGGTYMGVVYGFAGLRVKEDGLTFRPQLPQGWKSYRFRFLYQDSLLELSVDRTGAAIKLVSGTPKSVRIWDKTVVAE